MSLQRQQQLTPLKVRELNQSPTVKPVLSICIPAFQHAQYIEECISSINASTERQKIEIVIIDDCSLDNTVKEAIDALGRTDMPYRVYRNEENMGLNFGLKFLLSEAKADYVLFCASDDRLVSTGIDRLISQISQVPINTFLVCSAQYFGDRSGAVYNAKKFERLFLDTSRLHFWLSTRIPKPLLLQSTVFNAAFLRQISPWDDGLLLDDWPTFIKVTKQAAASQADVYFSKTILTEYRVHSDGAHRNFERQKAACFEVVDRIIEPELRARARSRVYCEFSIRHLSQGQLSPALSYYVSAMRSELSVASIGLVPLEALKGLTIRCLRLVRSAR